MAGRTLFITGASRGIGKAIALKAAKDGANVVVAAKTADPHPKLPGTIYSAAEESMYLKLVFNTNLTYNDYRNDVRSKIIYYLIQKQSYFGLDFEL